MVLGGTAIGATMSAHPLTQEPIMSHAPTQPPVPPTADAAAPRRRRWRAARGLGLSTAAAAVAVAAGLAVQACAGERLTASGTAGSPAAPRATDAGSGIDAAKTAAGGTPGTGDLAWVGALHNRGLDSVIARARRASDADRATPKTRCALIGRLTTEFLAAERRRDPRLAAALSPPPGSGVAGDVLGGAVLARIAHDAACTAGSATRHALVDAVGTAAARTGERRSDLGTDGIVSPAALFLLAQVDDAIRWMPNATVLHNTLAPIRSAAESLPDAAEMVLVREAIETASASGFYHEGHCQTSGACNTPDRPPSDSRARPTRTGGEAARLEQRAGVIRDLVQADAWGCIFGGFRGALAGGPSGAAVGCFWGGIAGSGSVMFRHMT
jgi:hypothetical protein